MPLPNDLQVLLTSAGRARADERRRAEAMRRQRERERAGCAEAEERAQVAAPVNALAIWAWLKSDEGGELRAAMRAHGIEEMRLGVFGIEDGKRRAGPSFGSCTVGVLADAVAVRVVTLRGYLGGRVACVSSPGALAENVPPCALATLADEVRGGRALELVRRYGRP